LLARAGRFYALELKSDRGRLSATQIAMHAQLRRAGAVVRVAGSIDEALGLLVEWGVL
jgi:hypothetical protein